jgi:maleylpyruvate isomerase
VVARESTFAQGEYLQSHCGALASPDMVPDLVLYNYWRSSSSHRVRIALHLKNLEYRYVPINLLADEQSGQEHKARSPTGYVPCLVIDGVPYVESVAIIELLDERFPAPPLYPKDPHGRARLRALVEIINSGTQPLQNRHVMQFLSEDVQVQRRWVQHFVGRGLASFEAAMEVGERDGVRGPYAYGATPTAADVFLVPQVVAARRFHVDLAQLPRVSRAYEAALQLEAFAQAAPDRQPDAVTP